MKYSDLLIEKTKVRTSNPLRYKILTMVLDGASKKAKSELREVEDKDIVASAKSLIKADEKAMELVKTHGGDTTEYETEMILYTEFLPVFYTPEVLNALIENLIQENTTIPPVKKSMGKFMGKIQSREDFDLIDMSMASKILQTKLV